jgi:hypothetical protein
MIRTVRPEVTWMSMKPTFSASKVASLINMNPFEKVFETVFETMARHDIPLCTESIETGKVQLEEKKQLETHLRSLVSPFITEQTTVQDLQKMESNLSILGPLGPQAASYARLRFGQVAEQTSVNTLKEQGSYGKGEYKKVEFKHFYLVGQTDGTFNGKIVEIKNRRARFMGVTAYEKPQFECYMRLFGVPDLYLCETLKCSSGLQQKMTLVESDDTLWSVVLQRLTLVSKFMKEVQDSPFLQQVDKHLLEEHFHRFILEHAQL